MLIAVACVALPLRWTWSVRSVRTSDAPFASRRARLATARDADDFAVVTQALASAVEAESRVSTRASPPPDSLVAFGEEDEDPDRSLQRILLTNAARSPGRDADQCLRGVHESAFSHGDDEMLRQIMRKIRAKRPWAWIRLADGDLGQLKNDVVSKSDARRRFARAIETWPDLENLVVSVGSWWLCNKRYETIWHERFNASRFAVRSSSGASPEDYAPFAFHAGCFYLPMGTPDDDDRDAWAAKGIVGWVRAAREAGVKLALVGPRYLKDVPWLAEGVGWVDAAKVSASVGALDEALARCAEISRAAKRDSGNPDEPVLFVFQAGWAAKVMITELAHPSKPTSADMFVDAGTALDGFAGKGTRTFNKGEEGKRKYCENVVERVGGEEAKFWVLPEALDAYGCERSREAIWARRAAKEEAMKTKHCVAWRRTGGCDPEGPREPRNDAPCANPIPKKTSGFCECAPGPPKRETTVYEALVREGVVRPPRSAGGRGCDGTKTTKHSYCESECEKAWKEELARLELAVDEGREDGRTEKMLRVAAALVREWMDASVSA